MLLLQSEKLTIDDWDKLKTYLFNFFVPLIKDEDDYDYLLLQSPDSEIFTRKLCLKSKTSGVTRESEACWIARSLKHVGDIEWCCIFDNCSIFKSYDFNFPFAYTIRYFNVYGVIEPFLRKLLAPYSATSICGESMMSSYLTLEDMTSLGKTLRLNPNDDHESLSESIACLCLQGCISCFKLSIHIKIIEPEK